MITSGLLLPLGALSRDSIFDVGIVLGSILTVFVGARLLSGLLTQEGAKLISGHECFYWVLFLLGILLLVVGLIPAHLRL